MSIPTVDSFLFILDIIRENKKFHMVLSGKPFQFQGIPYEPMDMVFKEASMKSGGKGASEGFNISIPKDSSAGDYLSKPLASTSTTAILRMVTLQGKQELILRGFVNNVSDEGRMLGLEISTLRVSLGHVGLNLKYSNLCHHTLYGQACKIGKTAFPVSIANEMSAASGGGYMLAVAGAVPDPDHYDYGFLTIESDGVTLYSPITKVVPSGGSSFSGAGNALVFIPRYLGELVQGKVAKLHKGCDLTFTTCHDRFSNTANFGGFPFFTGTDNPFSNEVLNS